MILIIIGCLGFFLCGIFGGLGLQETNTTNKSKMTKGGWFLISAFCFCYGVMSMVAGLTVGISSSSSFIERTIDKYREGEIVEVIDYRYKIIDGEKVVVDSTKTYIMNRGE